MKTIGWCCLGMLAVTGCVPSAENSQNANTVEDLCGAGPLQAYVGQPVDSYDFQANHPKLRIIPHGGAATMDFVPDRLNVTLTPDRQIERIFCG